MNFESLTKEQLVEYIKAKDKKIQELEQVIKAYHKKIEEITLSENIMRAVFESTTDGMVVKDEKFNITNINKGFKDIWELEDKYSNETDKYKLAEYCKDKVINSEEFVKSINSIELENKENLDYLYFRNGKIVERIFQPLKVNGEVRGRVWSFRDITGKRNLEKCLEAREELSKRLINKLPDGILVYENGNKIIANEAAKRFASTKLRDYNLGDNLKVHPDYREIVDERMKKLLREDTEVDFLEQKIILDDGSIGDVEVAGFSFKQEENFYVTVIMRDISDRKKLHKLEMDVLEKSILLEQAKEYNELKTQLFSIVSHELKTPLNIILGGIQLLQKSFDDQRAFEEYYYRGITNLDFEAKKKYLASMKQNCYRLLRLINNFIDMNKIESGFFKLELENKNIINTVENITLSVVDYVESKGITLIFDTEVEERILACDEDKLERVILNLLSNAIKFTEVGGRIQVNIYDKAESIVISVKDSGCGISEDMHSRIFEPFTQADFLLRRRTEGSGIGLTLVKSLIELHGGTISVNSDLGKGSEFIIELPVRLVENSEVTINNIGLMEDKIEKITVEFSDIYS